MSDQIKYDFTDPETGEVFPVNGTSLVSNVRDILMSRRRNQVEAKTWSMLNEAEQQDEITSMQELAKDLVGKVVEVVAEKGLVCAHVAIQKFAVDVDKGIVQITSSGYASDQMLTDLAHSKGKVAKLTVVDERQFNEKSTLLVADKDQPSLLPDDEDGAAGENDHVSDEDMYARAVALVKSDGKCSTSYIQRKLAIGYNKAAKFIERMEAEGIVSAANDVGKREIIEGDDLSDQDVEDIGAQMDAEADGMDEPDDLHDPEPDAPVADPASDERVAGHYARMSGEGQMTNPYLGGTGSEVEFSDWDSGWLEADASGDAPEIVDNAVEVDDQAEGDGADVDQGAAKSDEETQSDDTETQSGDPATDDADNAPDLGDLTPMQHGQQARLKGDGPDDNPFDGGTDGHAEWAGGYEAADAEIKTLIEAGRKAGADGEDKKKCPWKKGTDGERFWLQGWEAGQAEA